MSSLVSSLQQTLQDAAEEFQTAVETNVLPLLETVTAYVRQNKATSVFVGCVSLLILRYPYITLKRRYLGLPPGPIGLPIVGHLPMRLYGSLAKEYYIRMAMRYGPVCYTDSANLPLIIISHSEIIKDIIAQRHLNNRLNITGYSVAGTPHGLGELPFVFISGNSWKQRRKLASSLLANVPSSILSKMTDESLGETLLPMLINEYNNKEWYPRKDLMWLAFNTLYHYNVGVPVDRNDSLWTDLCDMIDWTFKNGAKGVIFALWPFLRYTSLVNTFDKSIEKRTKLIESLINRREEVKNGLIDSKSKLKDTYIDAMLVNEKNGDITRDAMMADIMALFMAGTDTTASTLEFALVLFAKYPVMQTRFANVCKELWEMNGKPTINEKYNFKTFKLNWLIGDGNKKLQCEFKAFIYEIMRIACIAGHGVMHFNTDKDEKILVKKEYGTIDGKDHTYIIPKNSFICYNTEYIHRYSKYEKQWKHKNREFNNIKNDEICLENWYKNNKNDEMVNIASMPYITFGIGKRDCVGRQLAVNEFESFIAGLILNFKFSFDKQKYGNIPGNVPITLNRAFTSSVGSPLSVRVARRVQI